MFRSKQQVRENHGGKVMGEVWKVGAEERSKYVMRGGARKKWRAQAMAGGTGLQRSQQGPRRRRECWTWLCSDEVML